MKWTLGLVWEATKILAAGMLVLILALILWLAYWGISLWERMKRHASKTF